MEGQSADWRYARGPSPRPAGLRRSVRPVWGSVAALTYLFAAAVLLWGCGAMGSERAGPSSDGGETRGAGVPETARIVCGPEGTRVLTPRVKARPDGVHFVIDNRFEVEVGYAFEEPEGGGGGDSAPEGESEHVGDFPPGEVRIGCEEPPVDGVGTDYAPLEVVDPAGFYRQVELECRGGMAVGGGPQYAAGAEGKKGDVVEMVRRGLSDRLREGDTVELAGYPKSRDSRTVRVVREGRVVAAVVFFADSGGWLEDSTSNCAGF